MASGRHAPHDDTAPLYALERTAFAPGARTLLHPLNLTLEPERVHGLIGHNGSGKSTLLKLLARQLQPTAGVVRFAGKPLAAWPHREFAREVAYLPQQPPAADGMLVRELVALGRYPWHGALGRFTREDAARVDEAMTLTDVARHADRPVDSLSGGERQRAWIAMLVAQDCRCMLLDEPTSALDIGHQLGVLQLVRDLCARRRMTAVVVLHDVNMAARFCDDVFALREGRMLMRATPAELMRAGTLETIYGVPMDVLSDPASGRVVGVPR
ncbi:ATP-binding cassette domain-containing protein [Paraburkholderia sp. D15]|uniref:ATP-binding cassette domain-containing protein n=1 Tax=Paraburkholderia sp. D15 TaxID=2880218 RepID=UPI00247AE685|nr:ATP-binding cassette domain-containing protein [Paraburkholderia sp. D15]WGS54829.1 ATP-binding cassette domain-containing protein [Paraburkholderia sp. D15]